MAFSLSFGGDTLDGISTWNEPFELKVQADEFPRRHGSLVQQVAFARSKRIAAAGRVTKSSEANLKTYLEDMKQKFMESGRDHLVLRDDSRYLNAICTAFAINLNAAVDPSNTATFSLEFFADDPFWYSTTEQEDNQSSVGSSPHTYSVSNSGKVATPPRIEIKAAGGADATDVKLTNTTTSLFARYAGTITNGNTLVIDCAERTVQNGGTNGLNDFTGSFWELMTDTNNLKYTGPTGVDVNVFWTERWP